MNAKGFQSKNYDLQYKMFLLNNEDGKKYIVKKAIYNTKCFY